MAETVEETQVEIEPHDKGESDFPHASSNMWLVDIDPSNCSITADERQRVLQLFTSYQDVSLSLVVNLVRHIVFRTPLIQGNTHL